MKISLNFLTISAVTVLICNSIDAQDSLHLCKVEMKNLIGTYSGDCKNGYANGKGEARGIDRYSGNFKFGFPEGKGTYYYADSAFYTGNFQEGRREGKGEMHYFKKELPESIVKGYWCADEYTGKKYITYNFDNNAFFDRVEIIPSPESGNTFTIELSTTSGSPNGYPNSLDGRSGNVLVLTDIISTNSTYLRKLSGYNGTYKSSLTYELGSFPAKLYISLSNGRSFNLELIKPAKWLVRLFVNK